MTKRSHVGSMPTSFRAVRQWPWASAALVVTLFLAVAAVVLVPLLGRDADGALSLGPDWIGDLADFYLMVYQTGTFQVFIAMLVLGSLAETFLPARREGRSAGALNVAFGAMMLLFVSTITPLPLYVADAILESTGWRNVLELDLPTEDSILMSALAMLISALIADFFFYWFHRLQHANCLLWQQHLVHHSDVALNVTTTQRAHFIEQALTLFAVAVPMTVLFNLPTPGVAAIAVVPSAWAYVVHTNVRLGFGPLWWLITSPQYHRIHHSTDPAHHNRNFALWFPLWDVLFGTAYAPRRGEFPSTGVEGAEVATLRDAFMFPFARWHTMAADELRRRRAHHG